MKKYLILKGDVDRFSDAARAGRRRASPLVLKCEADSVCDVRWFFERGSAGCCGSKMPDRTGKEDPTVLDQELVSVVVGENAQAFSRVIA